MFKRLARWLLRRELWEMKRETEIMVNYAYQKALKNGYGIGKIVGGAEARNRGAIVGGVDMKKEVEEILRSKEF